MGFDTTFRFCPSRLVRSAACGTAILVALVLTISAGCKSDKRGTVSSEAFLAPQVDSGATGVTVAINRLEILRELYRTPGGSTKLDGELLAGPPPNLLPLGKLDATRLLVQDKELNVLITIDIRNFRVKKVLERDEFLGLFRNVTTKPVLPSIVELSSGWILAFETNSRSLVAFALDPANPDGVVANQVLDRTEIEAQVFAGGARTAVTIRHMVEFRDNDILVVPEADNVTALHHLNVFELTDPVTDDPVLEGRFLLAPEFEAGKNGPKQPFLDFDKIRQKTGNLDVSVKHFPPVPIPGSNRVLLFDRATATASFLELVYQTEELAFDDPTLVLRAAVEVTVRRNELEAILPINTLGGTGPSVQTSLFEASFLHPNALLPASAIGFQPLIVAYDQASRLAVAYNWKTPVGRGSKVSLLSTSTQNSDRIDLTPGSNSAGVNPDDTTTDLRFAKNDVSDNRLAFDLGPSDLVSLNYDTGSWVIVLKSTSITKATQSTQSNVRFIEAISESVVRALDIGSASLLNIQIKYTPVPVIRP